MIPFPRPYLAINREGCKKAIIYAKCLDNAYEPPINAIIENVSCLKLRVTLYYFVSNTSIHKTFRLA